MIGVLPGMGIGAEVVSAALKVLSGAAEAAGIAFDLRTGGPIGEGAVEAGIGRLSEPVVAFCEDVFGDGGAILSGPAGGRYVYDLRRRFDLFCKFAPVRVWPVLSNVARVRLRDSAGLDFLIVRDNCGGVYQGTWGVESGDGGSVAHHAFSYSQEGVRQLARVGVSAAASRRGHLHVVVKDGGVPSISALWHEVVDEVARGWPVKVRFVNVDLAVYELVQKPEAFDVILAPNLFGDVLVDLSAVLQGSRGVTFSGNFNGRGQGVYQTNHGCALDLANTDTANPSGQILSLAMMLRESFRLEREAGWIESALVKVWEAGWRTADLAESGCRIVGTQAMADRVVEQVRELAHGERTNP